MRRTQIYIRSNNDEDKKRGKGIPLLIVRSGALPICPESMNVTFIIEILCISVGGKTAEISRARFLDSPLGGGCQSPRLSQAEGECVVKPKEEVAHLPHGEEVRGKMRSLGAIEKRGRGKNSVFRRIGRSFDIQYDFLSCFLIA